MPIEKPEQNKFSPTTNKMLVLASMFAMPFIVGNSKPRFRDEKIDIVKEFELIQNKKSNLSRAKREWVVSQFESSYKEIL